MKYKVGDTVLVIESFAHPEVIGRKGTITMVCTMGVLALFSNGMNLAIFNGGFKKISNVNTNKHYKLVEVLK